MSRRQLLVLLLVLLASLGGLGGAYVPYRSYAAIWRRPIAKMPRCVLAARIVLRKPSVVSGSEPATTRSGETVYLTRPELLAVRCVKPISEPLSGRFAEAFSQTEPELRGLELLKILRDVPSDASHDPEASAAYFIGTGALAGLPDLPEVKAASDEMDAIHACRFVSKIPCPSRPPIPVVVWILGVPSALGVLFVLGSFIRAGALAVRDRLRARRERKKLSAGAPPAQPAQ